MAQTRRERKRGLLGRSGMAQGSALVIVPCGAVHTFGMQFAIDAVFVDAHGRVKKIVHDLQPWRMAACLSARAVIEMPAGTLAAEGALSVGDRLYVELTATEAPPPVNWESCMATASAR